MPDGQEPSHGWQPPDSTGDAGRRPQQPASSQSTQQPGSAAPQGNSVPRTPAKRTWSWLLSHPGWAGIGTLVAILALVLAVIQFISDSDSSPDPASIGDCSATGENVNVECTQITNIPELQSITELGLDVSWADNNTWYFEGPVGELPTPPDYPAVDKYGHCEDWADYFSSNPKFFSTGPAVLLEAASGLHDQVAITNIRVNLFSHRDITTSPAARSFVKCQHGAGLAPGYYVTVDTRSNETSVSGGRSDIAEASMPPASIVISNTQSSTLITVLGDPARLYEGQIVVTAMLNGDERTVELGTKSAPLRWVGFDPGAASTPPDSGDTVVDWDLDTKSWVRI